MYYLVHGQPNFSKFSFELIPDKRYKTKINFDRKNRKKTIRFI